MFPECLVGAGLVLPAAQDRILELSLKDVRSAPGTPVAFTAVPPVSASAAPHKLRFPGPPRRVGPTDRGGDSVLLVAVPR